MDGLAKSQKVRFPVIPAKPESREFNWFWTPAFAGVTNRETFYEFNIKGTGKRLNLQLD